MMNRARHSFRLLLLVVIGFCGVLPTWATWKLDTMADPNTISDGTWTLKVYCLDATKKLYAVGTKYDQSAYVAGSGELDLRTIKADTGATIVEFKKSSMQNNSQITSLKLPETVTTFGMSCFAGCANLVSVEPFLPGTTTSLASHVFQKCTKLTGDLYLTNDALTVVNACSFEQDLITSVHFSPNLEKIDYNAFYNCNSLTEMSPMDFPKLKYIGDYVGLRVGGDTLRLTSPELSYIGASSFYCSSFTNLVLSPTVTTIGQQAFRQNANLKTVKLVPMRKRKIPTTSVVFAGFAFNRCSSLCDVELPFRSPFDIKGYTFELCSCLTNITFWGAAPTTVEANYRTPYTGYELRFTGSLQQDAEGWANLTTDLTDAEKQKATYPGKKCFGTMQLQTPIAWLVSGKSPYDPTGFVMSIP